MTPRNQRFVQMLREDLLAASEAFTQIDDSLVGRKFRQIKRDVMLCLEYLDGAPIKVLANRYRIRRRGMESIDAVCDIARKYGCPPRYAKRIAPDEAGLNCIQQDHKP